MAGCYDDDGNGNDDNDGDDDVTEALWSDGADDGQAVLYTVFFFTVYILWCNGKFISEWKWLHNAVTRIIME